jgi:hypothetical protein
LEVPQTTRVLPRAAAPIRSWHRIIVHPAGCSTKSGKQGGKAMRCRRLIGVIEMAM